MKLVQCRSHHIPRSWMDLSTNRHFFWTITDEKRDTTGLVISMQHTCAKRTSCQLQMMASSRADSKRCTSKNAKHESIGCEATRQTNSKFAYHWIPHPPQWSGSSKRWQLESQHAPPVVGNARSQSNPQPPQLCTSVTVFVPCYPTFTQRVSPEQAM